MSPTMPAEAIAKYLANPPHLLVLDIMLPDMDGLAVLIRSANPALTPPPCS